jgi:hypothetical protein
MEIFEILFAVAVWVLVSYLGWRKRKALPGQPSPAAPEEIEGEEAPPPAAEPSMPKDLRDLIRHLRGEFDQGQRTAEPKSQADAPRPTLIEESHVEPPPEPRPAPRLAPVRIRQSPLAGDLLHDLTSGPRSLARAMLLREVLGPPVAMREPGSDLPGTGG